MLTGPLERRRITAIPAVMYVGVTSFMPLIPHALVMASIFLLRATPWEA